jgi:hypothetical protein
VPRVVKFLSRLACAAVAALALPATASAAGELAIVSSVRVEAPKGWFTGQPLRFSFTVRNQTAAPVAARAISVPVRSSADPAGAIDTVCTNGIGVTIPPGGVFECVAPREEGYPVAATYTFWADWWSETDGTWHHGELGPDQNFVLTAPPQTTLVTDAQVSVGEQGLGGARDTTLTVTNTGGAVLLIDRGMSFGGLHPGDFAIVGDSCTQDQIMPGAACNLVVRFTPQAAGVRAATLSLKSNAGSPTINLSGAGVAQAAPVVVTAPERLNVTVSYFARSLGRRNTRFTRLSVRGVPKGATVRVTCSKGCSRKAVTFRRSGAISLMRFARRPLRVGTKLSVRVTRAGTLGVVKTLTVRASKRPGIATTCLDLAGKRAACAR